MIPLWIQVSYDEKGEKHGWHTEWTDSGSIQYKAKYENGARIEVINNKRGYKH